LDRSGMKFKSILDAFSRVFMTFYHDSV
jgi:hypothetical protein